jgi:putative ABC transport system substrate-binding protein
MLILAIGVATASLAAAQSQKIPRLCFLTFDPGTAQSPSPRFAAFFQGLRELGYVHGQTITIDYLLAQGSSERFPELATECLRLKADIIAVTTTPAALAVKNATRTIPTVMVALGDPVGTGLVDSLARPGGNLTGMSQMTSGLAAKRLEVLKEAVPAISRVLVLSYLVDPIAPLQIKALKEAAPSLGVTLLIHDIRTADERPGAFDGAVREHAQGAADYSRKSFPSSTRSCDRTRCPPPLASSLSIRGIRSGQRGSHGL